MKLTQFQFSIVRVNCISVLVDVLNAAIFIFNMQT